ncbi:hypothetical protein AAJCM20276_33590 [Acetobacter aceti]|uniref:Uncharacterized protein n=1 Tax=Acetobacter aceti TaxID=435 RepID=A0A6S6PQ38_ACEAC|nr:hypothetical protein AAJCM20276_33590 [Acetobacter aceti]
MTITILDGVVHPLDLTIGPGMFHLSQTVLDPVLVADSVENAVKSVLMTGLRRKREVGLARGNRTGYLPPATEAVL